MKKMFLYFLVLPLISSASDLQRGDVSDLFVTGQNLNFESIVFDIQNWKGIDRIEVFENGKLSFTSYNYLRYKSKIAEFGKVCESLKENKPQSALECRLKAIGRELNRFSIYSVDLLSSKNLVVGKNSLKFAIHNIDGTIAIRFFNFELKGSVEIFDKLEIQKDLLEKDIDVSESIQMLGKLGQSYPGLVDKLIISQGHSPISQSSAKVDMKAIVLNISDLSPMVVVHEFSHVFWEERLSGVQKVEYTKLYDQLLENNADEVLVIFKEGTYVESGGGHPETRADEMYASMSTLTFLKSQELAVNIQKLPMPQQDVIKQMQRYLPNY